MKVVVIDRVMERDDARCGSDDARCEEEPIAEGNWPCTHDVGSDSDIQRREYHHCDWERLSCTPVIDDFVICTATMYLKRKVCRKASGKE